MDALRICKSALWNSGFLLALCASRYAGGASAKIQIVVYDGAALGQKTLSAAEDLTGKILLTSGLEAQWSAGPTSDLGRLGMDFSPPARGACSSPLVPVPLRVQILARALAGVPAQMLGFSLPCAVTGFQITMFADHVAKVSQMPLPTFQRVLGYALAHELGHVLLHSAEHDDSGLMKAAWSKSDWQRAAFSIIPFSTGQTRRILGAIQGSPGAEMTWAALRVPKKR
jgi:hypothetical protein